MVVIDINTPEEYTNLVKSDKVTVALFSAEWAEQCKQILDVMKELAVQKGLDNMQFINVPAEDFSEISLKHQIEAVPTVIFFQNNTAIDRIDGVDIAALTAKSKKFGVCSEEKDKSSLEDRLKGLINKAKVMIFMKGEKDAPRCGFSKQLVAILNETGVSYDTFDILSDEEVRQGLKTYSDWPTYPQVYVSGELIGGLDIVKELVESGELLTTLKG